VIAAKQMATVDHISRGRFGLNIVCGWNQDEFEMFGLDQREHDVRYDYGQEWWDVVRRLWTEEARFDFEGRFLRLEDLEASPKPYGGRRPIVMNAGSSPAGRRFAARNCDVMFTALIDFDRAQAQLAGIRAEAAEFGRSVALYTSSHVVCRPTAKEARDYHHHYAIESADEAAVDRLMTLQGLHAKSYPTELIAKFRSRFAGGHGSYPIVGDPDHVAAEFRRISEAGFAGATIATVNYLADLPYLIQEVLPRLERMGLRRPAIRRP
jgi:alkanesulfonate monooxygenase SsuD/methylene tetrahydromethanopterin reductase-like flavin-dependent oxidoreductase (luciferase family)